jgi:hypothetical protein
VTIDQDTEWDRTARELAARRKAERMEATRQWAKKFEALTEPGYVAVVAGNDEDDDNRWTIAPLGQADVGGWYFQMPRAAFDEFKRREVEWREAEAAWDTYVNSVLALGKDFPR